MEELIFCNLLNTPCLQKQQKNGFWLKIDKIFQIIKNFLLCISVNQIICGEETNNLHSIKTCCED